MRDVDRSGAAWWWSRARARWMEGEPPDPADVDAWNDLSREDRRRIAARLDKGLRHPDPAVRAFAWKAVEDTVVATMDRDTGSAHLRLEIAAVHHRARPLDPGEPVPGCGCEACTGVPEDDVARVPAWRRRNPERAARTDAERRREWERLVENARRVPLLDVVARLGLGEPVKRGRELAVRCPLHEDTDPSCRLDTDAGLWYCDPCGEGGDGIQLYMSTQRVDFAEAVRELAP